MILLVLLTLALAAPSTPCAECHPEEHAAWSISRHRASWTNPLFQAEYNAGPQSFCIPCHLPVAEHPDEGIGCSSCHAAEGESDHPTQTFGAPEDCGRCHDADFPGLSVPAPLQATLREWQATTAASGRTCTDCHMPGGDHRFRGGHDVDLLKKAVQVEVERQGNQLRFTLRSHRTGHALPTGDLFRHLVLEGLRPDGSTTALASIGRQFELTLDPETGAAYRRQVLDTRLWPGKDLHVLVPAGLFSSWRLVYHYTSEESPLPPELTRVTVASGPL